MCINLPLTILVFRVKREGCWLLLGVTLMRDGGRSKLKAPLLHPEVQGCQEHLGTLGTSDTKAEQMPAEAGALPAWLSDIADSGIAVSCFRCWGLRFSEDF